MRRLLTLIKIEGRLTIRCIDSIFFGVIMPVGIAVLIGMICGNKPAYNGATHTFIEESFGALITVGICATAFMGIPLGIADYRDKKILKHYFVTPVSPAVILIVQVILNFIIAIISSICVYLTMKLFFAYEMKGSLPGFLLSYILVAVAMYGLGMLIASVCSNLKIANLVCTLIYFPMLFLSGATIPYEILPAPLQSFSNILPLTQGIKLLKGYSIGVFESNLLVPIFIMIASAIISIGLSFKLFRWE